MWESLLSATPCKVHAPNDRMWDHFGSLSSSEPQAGSVRHLNLVKPSEFQYRDSVWAFPPQLLSWHQSSLSWYFLAAWTIQGEFACMTVRIATHSAASLQKKKKLRPLTNIRYLWHGCSIYLSPFIICLLAHGQNTLMSEKSFFVLLIAIFIRHATKAFVAIWCGPWYSSC